MRLGIVAVLALGLGGCAELSKDQQARIGALMEENRKLVGDMDVLYAKLKDGSATVEEVLVGVSKIKLQIETNLKQVETIREEGASTWAIIGGIAGMLGRTVLHGAAKIPIGGPIGMVIQTLLGLLLGGSATNKKELAKA